MTLDIRSVTIQVVIYMVGPALYLDENGDMPSEKALRKRRLTIRELRLLGIEPIKERKQREFIEVLPRDLKLATR